MRILPVASGKGGVGKSMVAANLAVAFAQAGKRVVLADLDLGASNLHLIIGHSAPKLGIAAFLANTRQDFSRLIVPTDVPGLDFIPGDTEIPGSANLKPAQIGALARRFLALETDLLILDLGAGTRQAVLDFFLLSGQGLVVTTPAITATLNAYGFLKNLVFRIMYTSFPRGSRALEYLEALRKSGAGLQRLYLPRILPEIEKADRKAFAVFKKRLCGLHPRLIMNMITDPKDAEAAAKIRRSCDAYLGLSLDYLGVLYRDSLQDTSQASRLPLLLYKPQSILAQGIRRIAAKILASPEDSFNPPLEEIEESYQEASAEAERDFESKIEYMEELLHSGEMTAGDLVETVKTQQFELSKLKKENNFLKKTLSRAMAEGFKP